MTFQTHELAGASRVPANYLWALAIWALCEATFWFVAPDFLLIPLAIFFPRDWLRIALAGWGASVVGGAAYFAIVASFPESSSRVLASTPFISARMHAFIKGLYEQYGYWGALAQSWSFMTLKVWTLEAVKEGFNFFPYYVIVSFSRIFRLFVVTRIAARFSVVVRPFWSDRPLLAWGLYSTGFIGMLFVMES